MAFKTDSYANILAVLQNEFPNDELDTLQTYAKIIMAEQRKEGDSVLNLINQICR